MNAVFELREIEPSLPLRDETEIALGTRFRGPVVRRYARHGFSLPTQHFTAHRVVLDPVTAMVFHAGMPLPWSCFFGPHDSRVPGDWSGAEVRHRSGSRSITGRRVYCGFNRHCRNYAHWITQCVPAIAGYALEPEFADGILLLPDIGAAYEEALVLAGITLPEVVRVDLDHTLAVEELVYSSLLLHHFAPSVLARRVFDRMVTAAMAQPEATTTTDRIYVSRVDSTARPMTNEDELVRLLARHGIEPLIPGTMSLREQVCRFRAASLVVGPHGAGLGNIVFCRPKSMIYELIPEHWINSFVGPSINLFAQTSRMHYWADAHPSLGTFTQYGHQVPWTVDLVVTEERLTQIEAAHPRCG